MSRETILIALGVLVALSPYLGLPLSLLAILLPVLGLSIIAIGVTQRMRANATQHLIRPHVYEAPEA